MAGDEGRADLAGRDVPRWLLPVALGVLGLEVLGLLAYAVALAVSVHADGGKVSVGPVLVSLYVIYAALLALVGRGLARGRHWARTPYGLAQAFGLIVAYTLAHGTGAWPHALAVVVGLVSAVGLGVAVSRPMGRYVGRSAPPT